MEVMDQIITTTMMCTTLIILVANGFLVLYTEFVEVESMHVYIAILMFALLIHRTKQKFNECSIRVFWCNLICSIFILDG